MKKLLLIAVAAMFAISSYAQIDNGFSLKLNLGFPSADYGGAEDSEIEAPLSVGLQIGNQWYFFKESTFGIGLNVNWFDISRASKTEDDYSVTAWDLRFIEFGPLGTIKIQDEMGVDIYYNLCPTLLMSLGYNDDSDFIGAGVGSGFTHAIGAGFRYQIFYAGLEYSLGDLSDAVMVDDDFEETGFKTDMVTNIFKICLGFKF